MGQYRGKNRSCIVDQKLKIDGGVSFFNSHRPKIATPLFYIFAGDQYFFPWI